MGFFQSASQRDPTISIACGNAKPQCQECVQLRKEKEERERAEKWEKQVAYFEELYSTKMPKAIKDFFKDGYWCHEDICRAMEIHLAFKKRK